MELRRTEKLMRRPAAVAQIVAIALLGAGCGGDDDRTGTDRAGADQTHAVQSTTAGAPAQDPAPTVAVADKDEPERSLASRQGQIDDDPVRLQIVELARGATTSTLTIRVTNTGHQGSAQIHRVFSDGEIGDESLNGSENLDGITLVDSRGAKRYLVARDSRGVCVCDTALGSTFLDPQTSLVLSATFAAPPAGVKAIDVVIPRFGAFRDVPLS